MGRSNPTNPLDKITRHCRPLGDFLCHPKNEGVLDLRKMEDWNRASVGAGKPMWHTLQCNESLWIKWVCSKISRGIPFWCEKIKPQRSMAWRSILLQGQWMPEVVHYRVGNGCHFNFWSDPWINGTSISSLYGDGILSYLGLPPS
uniref:Putative ribonuclease H protein At1g65750 n=1 Tax=Anthurium amnicola TaxID=1678845 RepID=A0A1D1XGY0_9ARAE